MATMQNDLSVVRVDKKFKLNKWVGIVCVPPLHAQFPRPGDTCTAVGWGATYEHGPDPDHMHEVDVPIMSTCKHQADRDAEEICAGAIEGGRDTCQGDSGGPLLCRSSLNWAQEWYVSGIVSHGEGCARPGEPGAYTRVSLYTDWIIEVIAGKVSGVQSLIKCPGKYCNDGRCIVSSNICDGIVDCLNAEDEINCGNSEEDIVLGENFDQIIPIFRGSKLNKTKTITEKPKYSLFPEKINFNALSLFKSSTLEDNETSSKNNTEKDIETKKEIVTDSPFLSINHTTFYEHTQTKPEIADPTVHHSSFETNNQSETSSYESTTEGIALTTNKSRSTNFKEPGNEKSMIEITTMENLTQPIFNATDSVYIKNTFSCQRFDQEIKIDNRCDGFMDCEDGSDEENCTCKERLQHLNPQIICDSNLDCFDKTDEVNCQSHCKEGEVFLPSTKMCIPEISRCNFIEEYPDAEDETGCYFLVQNATYVHYKNETISPSVRGLVMWKKPGIPQLVPLCSPFQNFNESIKKTIRFLGFGEWEWVVPVKFPGIHPVNCTGIYGVTHDYPMFGKKAPWLASIKADNKPFGFGALIDDSWILTSTNPLFDDPKTLNLTFMSVRVGFLSTFRSEGPKALYEEVATIDKAVVVHDSDLILLRLKYPVRISPTVKPVDLLENIKRETTDRCYATGLVNENKILTAEASREPCSRQYTCYAITQEDNSVISETQSTGSSETWNGGIWCEDETRKPYLDCLFKNATVCVGACSIRCLPVFQHYTTLLNLTEVYGGIHSFNDTIEGAPHSDKVRRKRMHHSNVFHESSLFANDYSEINEMDQQLIDNIHNIFDYYKDGNLNADLVRKTNTDVKERVKRMINNPGKKRKVYKEEIVEEYYESHHHNHDDTDSSFEHDYNHDEDDDLEHSPHFKKSNKNKISKLNKDYEYSDDYDGDEYYFDSISRKRKATEHQNHTNGIEVTSSMSEKANTDDKEINPESTKSTDGYINQRNYIKDENPNNETENNIQNENTNNIYDGDIDEISDKIESSESHYKSNEPNIKVLDVGQELKCNGVADCMISEDKDKSTDTGCKISELNCGDGQCIPLEKFCDGTVDCTSKIDEPRSCLTNCSSYLAIKHPDRLCDGNPHCVDASDESWQTCGRHFTCNKSDAFTCQGETSNCIHSYQVCDGIQDCPQGDDEDTCIAIKSYPDSLWEGLLVTRVMGEWIPKCLKSHLPDETLEDICNSLRKSTLQSKSYKNISIERPFLEPYSTLQINSNLHYTILGDRPAIVRKQVEDCLSLHITCR